MNAWLSKVKGKRALHPSSLATSIVAALRAQHLLNVLDFNSVQITKYFQSRDSFECILLFVFIKTLWLAILYNIRKARYLRLLTLRHFYKVVNLLLKFKLVSNGVGGLSSQTSSTFASECLTHETSIPAAYLSSARFHRLGAHRYESHVVPLHVFVRLNPLRQVSSNARFAVNSRHH